MCQKCVTKAELYPYTYVQWYSHVTCSIPWTSNFSFSPKIKCSPSEARLRVHSTSLNFPMQMPSLDFAGRTAHGTVHGTEPSTLGHYFHEQQSIGYEDALSVPWRLVKGDDMKGVAGLLGFLLLWWFLNTKFIKKHCMYFPSLFLRSMTKHPFRTVSQSSSIFPNNQTTSRNWDPQKTNKKQQTTTEKDAKTSPTIRVPRTKKPASKPNRKKKRPTTSERRDRKQTQNPKGPKNNTDQTERSEATHSDRSQEVLISSSEISEERQSASQQLAAELLLNRDLAAGAVLFFLVCFWCFVFEGLGFWWFLYVFLVLWMFQFEQLRRKVGRESDRTIFMFRSSRCLKILLECFQTFI